MGKVPSVKVAPRPQLQSKSGLLALHVLSIMVSKEKPLSGRLGEITIQGIEELHLLLVAVLAPVPEVDLLSRLVIELSQGGATHLRVEQADLGQEIIPSRAGRVPQHQDRIPLSGYPDQFGNLPAGQGSVHQRNRLEGLPSEQLDKGPFLAVLDLRDGADGVFPTITGQSHHRLMAAVPLQKPLGHLGSFNPDPGIRRPPSAVLENLYPGGHRPFGIAGPLPDNADRLGIIQQPPLELARTLKHLKLDGGPGVPALDQMELLPQEADHPVLKGLAVPALEPEGGDLVDLGDELAAGIELQDRDLRLVQILELSAGLAHHQPTILELESQGLGLEE